MLIVKLLVRTVCDGVHKDELKLKAAIYCFLVQKANYTWTFSHA